MATRFAFLQCAFSWLTVVMCVRALVPRINMGGELLRGFEP